MSIKNELTKNEQKERRGKITCLFAILIPLILIGGYYAFSFYIVIQGANSFGKTYKESAKRRSIQRQKKDLEFLYSGLLKKNQHSTFTGIREKNDTIFTNALSITAIDSFSIKYKIESLINWKSEENIEGIATLDTTNYYSRIVNMEKGSAKSAFTFFEKKGNCRLEILISKEKRKESLKALVDKQCGNQETKRLTVIMNYK